eukprot:CAMPEP_0169444976 /NCGR_PEP_ID=MMETSP1042-20121227/10193_1 /TAXON_ID=464988 /ORGANISM="Hemiselmis andersenii, Strain CCMP1180" /LENGTH=891 /DNA_ID=CAMNT_0009556341 /DNA_START=80 /DNA_END=2752 /DNA_ORIENTATION=-
MEVDGHEKEHIPVIPVDPAACHKQKIVDFSLDDNVKLFLRPNRWFALNAGNGMRLVRVNVVVFVMASFTLWSFIIGTLAAPSDQDGRNSALREFSDIWQYWISNNFTWLYIGTQDAWVIFIIWIAFSKYGNLTLGKKNEKPMMSDVSWFALLFTCGVAVGFYAMGVSEPIWYYRGYANLKKPGFETDDQRAQQALFVTMYHWGIHAWGAYIVAALNIGFVAYRWDMPLTLRTAFFPLVGDVIHGLFGDFIDALSMVCTTFGVCTSLGLGVNVIIAGLHRIDCGSGRDSECPWVTVPSVDDTSGAYRNWAVSTIILVTCLATASVMAGLKSGLKNVALFAFFLGNLLLVCLLLLDNKWFLLNSIVQSTGYYLQYVIQVGFEADTWQQLNIEFDRSLSNQLWDNKAGSRLLIDQVEGATGEAMDSPSEHFQSHDATFIHWWTLFYWGWWISWVPFVGMFIAKISRGRTIRSVVLGGLVAPIAYTFVFMIVLGSLGIKMQRVAELALHETVPLDASGPNCTAMGYVSGQPVTPQAIGLADAGYYPLSCRAEHERLYDAMEPYGDGIASWLHLLCVFGVTVYFVTSSDSGSYVDDTLSAGGMVDPPPLQRLYWCVTEGMCAIALFWGGGQEALQALRALSVCMGLPLTFLLCFMCSSLLRAVKFDSSDSDIRSMTRFITGVWDFTEGFEPQVESRFLPSKAQRVVSLVLALFAPFLAMHSMHLRLFGTSTSWLHTSAQGVCFVIWIGCMIGETGTPNASFIGWTFFVSFVIHITTVRVMARQAYNVYGWVLEDFAACLFMYPMVCSQMELQAKALPVLVDRNADPNEGLDDSLDHPEHPFVLRTSSGKPQDLSNVRGVQNTRPWDPAVAPPPGAKVQGVDAGLIADTASRSSHAG